MLDGGAGDDRLEGGPGTDFLRGGPGADLFRFAALDGGADIVMDFDPAGGDALDLAALLTGFMPGADDPAAFVAVADLGPDLLVRADPGGAGGFVAVAVVARAAGTTLDDLLAGGGLIL